MTTRAPASPASPGSLSAVLQHTDIMLGLAILLVVGMMVIPMPTMAMDLLLALNIAFSTIILLVAVLSKEPLDFNIFPALLLVVTLYRLALNVSTTRLILLHGDAGEIVDSFGQFVVGGNVIVGIIIFMVLMVIQFLVITNGAGRVAEVAARFTLDAMPGKQMSIDADLNAGLITDVEARRRRERIAQEADFYGSMDGASKFVRGDAIAGLIIVAINLFGGTAIGMLQHGLSVSEAINLFALLSVGDGLVTQIPALLVSTASGIVITRSSGTGRMDTQITAQIFGNAKVLLVAGVLLIGLGLTPGLPLAPFTVVGGGIAGLGYVLRQRRAQSAAAAVTPAADARPQRRSPEEVVSLIQPDPMEIEIGYGLIPLVEDGAGDSILNRITVIRRQMAMELGMVVPTVRIRDNLQLPPSTYVIKLRGIEVGKGDLMMHHFLAMNPGTADDEIAGIPAVEPAFGLPALWIDAGARERAEMLGYTVVDPSSVVATHLTEVIRRYAPSILSRQDVQTLLNKLKEQYPAVVEELVPNLLTVGEIQRVLQNLLAERLPVRDLVTILETLANHAGQTRDPELLTEYARQALARPITAMHRDADGSLYAFTLSPAVERMLADGLQGETPALAIDSRTAQRIIQRISDQMERMAKSGRQPTLLVASRLRRPLRRLTERALPHLSILAFSEVAPDAPVQATGVVEVPE